MKIAALDLGSNTFLCLIAEVQNHKIVDILYDEVRMVRLGQGVSATKRFHPDALSRASAALEEFSPVIAKHKPDKILAMATSAARDVENASELLTLGQKFGIPIEIIPGNLEARLTFEGACSNLDLNDNAQRLIIDIGGGSTEFIYGLGSEIKFAHSLNLGCVRLKERTAEIKENSSAVIRSLAQLEIGKLFSMPNCPKVSKQIEILAVAGTPTEIVRIHLGGRFDPNAIDGFVTQLTELDKWAEIFNRKTPGQLTMDYGISAGRADVIGVGACILSECLVAFGVDRFTSSTRGVRHGIALELYRRESVN